MGTILIKNYIFDMLIFYYHTSCSLSRQIKVLLNFISVEYKICEEQYWEKEHFIPGNLFLPVIIESKIGNLEGHYSIIEYLLEKYPNLHLFPKNNIQLYDMRKLLYEINDVMNRQVCLVMVYEKFLRMFRKEGTPDIKILNLARKKLSYHIFYFSHLIKKRNFLLNDRVSVVDIALAAQISVIDYFGEINWCKYSDLSHWYRIVKSFSEFNVLFKERIAMFTPPKHYDSLDF